MSTFVTEVRQTLVPGNEVKHGPLPPLLLAMTLVTGLIDAFSYLALGHVFVANMTGNVVFLAFALAGAPGFSFLASLVALLAFVVGSLGGGLLGTRLGHHRGHLLWVCAACQTVLFGIAVTLAAFAGSPVTGVFLYSLIVVLGLAMGLQNAVARKLAVPDLTTTVLTLTITGIASDNRFVGGSGSKAGRRLLAVITMFVGVLVGSLLFFHAALVWPLVLAFIIMALIAVTAWTLGRSNPAWTRAGQ